MSLYQSPPDLFSVLENPVENYLDENNCSKEEDQQILRFSARFSAAVSTITQGVKLRNLTLGGQLSNTFDDSELR